ncbi:hypothetical protein A1O1_04308 [Capronia coronata CBS 617.96]|uniref:Uncharacterized protein n=1 Tax=Capronia coronata CBS 617.96 TaxID=1182541 RepID=W9Z9K4_9EURO|nr:uncharacterized protein A1O1_04308 [Capronia coronata CBS 617.96]EXJ91199.1 hypothetical protein A1O1_04308 [Capronia coronata CBS 617.96]
MSHPSLHASPHRDSSNHQDKGMLQPKAAHAGNSPRKMLPSSPAHTAFETVHGGNIGWSYSRTPGNDNSLFDEFRATVRRLLQHIVFISLLTLRLYMLPLLYMSRRLAISDEPWYPTAWQIVPHPGRAFVHCARCCKTEGNLTLGHTWANVRGSFSTTFKIIKALYSFGKGVGEDRNALQPDPALLLDPPGSAIDVQCEHECDSKIFDSNCVDPQPESSASASEIYHAALHNGSTLDDILAAFERSKKAGAARTDRFVIGQDLVAVTEREDADPRSPPNQPPERGYRTSSIQTTPERMLSGDEPVILHDCSTREDINDDMDAATPPIPVNKTEQSQKKVELELERTQSNENNVATPTSHAWHHTSAEQSGEKRVKSTARKRCPTFVRRQTQAACPEKHVSGEKRSLTVLQERATRSSPTLAIDSPTKRARLQRKVRVYEDPNCGPRS